MKAFWIIYEVLLLGCEALFILRLASSLDQNHKSNIP